MSAQWKKCNKRGSGEFPIKFGNTVNLQAGLYPGLTRLAAQEITFREGYTVIPPPPVTSTTTSNYPNTGNRGNNNKKRTNTKHIPYSATGGLQIEHNGGKLIIYSEAGLPHDVVEERNKRAQTRRKKAEKRRRRMEKERAQRAEMKAQEREADRQELLAEKK